MVWGVRFNVRNDNTVRVASAVVVGYDMVVKIHYKVSTRNDG